MEKWRVELTEKERAIVAVFDESTAAWLAAQSAESSELLTAASLEFDPPRIQSRIRNRIDEVESWFDALMKHAVADKAADFGHAAYKYNAPLQGWLQGAMSPHVAAVRLHSDSLEAVMLEGAKFARENSGVAGFLGGVIMGVSDPLEAVKGILGQSELDKEEARLRHELTNCGLRYGRSYDTLIDEIDRFIVSRWNSTMAEEVEKIKREIEKERDRLKELERELSDRIPVKEIVAKEVTQKRLGLVSVVFLVILLGLTIVVGIAVLRRFGLF